ncbi:MAG: hypothetical protein KF833_19950 [Verrucomicrobiae bacterium]|nr:hypothetical protein [Verrucomicrobiae bacterium]
MTLRLTTLHRLVVLATLALAIACLALLAPLSRRSRDRDIPLRDLRDQLARATLEAGLPDQTPFASIDEHLAALRAASLDFADAERAALLRLELPEDVRRYLAQPFQLLDFLNESQRRIEELTALAKASRVSLTPGLPAGFPRYQPDLLRPELLWVQLVTVNRLVRTAIQVGVRDISEVSVESLPVFEPDDFGPAPPPPLTPPVPTNAWSALRVHLTASGSVDALHQLLLALTLTPAQLPAVGLTEDLGAQPALFIDRILLHRSELSAPEQARLELVVSTVVPNARPSP